jgi:hypothetical protein
VFSVCLVAARLFTLVTTEVHVELFVLLTVLEYAVTAIRPRSSEAIARRS